MRSIADLRSRIDRLLRERRAVDEPPAVVFLLPSNERGPDNEQGPFPRARRVGRGVVVTFDAGVGEPEGAELGKLVREAT